MSRHEVNYQLVDWKEEVLQERPDGHKMTQVNAAFAYKGDLDGPTKLTYLMHYNPDQSGHFYGWEFFEGTWKDQPASAILHIQGSFDLKGVDAKAASVAGSQTGALQGLNLSYSIRFEGHGPYPVNLEVE